MAGGFRHSPLKLNQGLGACEAWNEDAMVRRAERLALVAAGIWNPPTLEPEILAAYRSSDTHARTTDYSLEDHPQLSGGIARELFDALRTEVLALDECVREEVLKLYVAYKAETNFVDVVPQMGRLLLSLNMQFHELVDPRGLARDVTGMGRWGNGDVEIGLSSPDDLSYVMGLVRQSFEKQMSSDDGELSPSY